MCRANHSPLSLLSTYHLLHTDAQLREPTRGRLQPIPLVIFLLALNHVERVDIPALGTGVLLALVQDVAMDKDERSRFDLAHIILLFLVHDLIFWLASRGAIDTILQILGEPRTFVVNEAGPLSGSHKPLLDGSALMATSCKAQAPVLRCRVLQRVPPSHRTRRIGIQKCAVLVWRHGASYLGLLAYDHGLEHSGVAERKRSCNGSIALGEGDLAK